MEHEQKDVSHMEKDALIESRRATIALFLILLVPLLLWATLWIVFAIINEDHTGKHTSLSLSYIQYIISLNSFDILFLIFNMFKEHKLFSNFTYNLHSIHTSPNAGTYLFM